MYSILKFVSNSIPFIFISVCLDVDNLLSEWVQLSTKQVKRRLREYTGSDGPDQTAHWLDTVESIAIKM